MHKAVIELQEIKSVLRSLMVSSKRSLSPENLQHEYKRVEGRPVPYRKFGHATFEDFLRSVPDICSVVYGDNGTVYVRPVVTESLQYIADLVSRQKEPSVSNKTKKPQARHTDKKFVPARLQHNLQNFVTSHPRGTPVEVLEKEVLSKFPHVLLGFEDTEEILQCASHILRFDDGHVFPLLPTSGETNHSNNTNGKISSMSKDDKEASTDCHMLPDNILSNIKKLMKENPNGVLATEFSSAYQEKFGTVFNILKYGYFNILSVVSAYSDILHAFRVTDEDFIIIEAPEGSDKQADDGSYPGKQNLKDMLLWLIQNFPDGLRTDQLAEMYELLFFRSLKPALLGFNSLEELLHNLESDSLVTLRDEKNELWVYPVVSLTRVESCTQNVMRGQNKSLVTGKTYHAAARITPHHNGNKEMEKVQLCNESPEQILFTPSSGVVEQNKSSVTEKTHHAAARITPHHNGNKEMEKVQLCNESPKQILFTPCSGVVEQDAEDEFDSIFTGYYPPGALSAYDEVPSQQLPSSHLGAAFEMVIIHAVSPSRFWAVLNYDGNCNALDNLIDDMQSFYNVYNESYRMSEPTICVGQYCVCPYLGKWHRARISNITSVSEVQVQLIDVGAVCKKKKAHLRFLRREFAEVPAQALCCCLAGVAATGQAVWPLEIRHLFVETVVGSTFTATLINTNHQSGILFVNLFEEADDGSCQSIGDWIASLEITEGTQTEKRRCLTPRLSLQEQLQKFTCI